MPTWLILWCGFWGGLGVVGEASKRSQGSLFVGFLAGAVLGPIGVIAVLLSPTRGRKCHACFGVIPNQASKCMHCGSDLAPPQTSQSGGSDVPIHDFIPAHRHPAMYIGVTVTIVCVGYIAYAAWPRTAHSPSKAETSQPAISTVPQIEMIDLPSDAKLGLSGVLKNPKSGKKTESDEFGTFYEHRVPGIDNRVVAEVSKERGVSAEVKGAPHFRIESFGSGEWFIEDRNPPKHWYRVDDGPLADVFILQYGSEQSPHFRFFPTATLQKTSGLALRPDPRGAWWH